MGLFSKSEGIPFRVWKTRAEELKGMSTEAMKAVTSGNDAVVVTFFDSRHLECKTFFEQKGIPFLDFADGASTSKGSSIFLIPAGKVETHRPSSLNNPSLLFHGISPLPGREARVAEKFPNARVKWCFASLQDPLFKVFGMENVASLMESLGMTDSECIEHKFVDKAIVSAQEKLAAKVRNETTTSSEEEWFQKNISK